MDEREVIALVEKRERAVRRLRRAIGACRQAELTDEEILQVVRPLLLPDDDQVLLEGSLFDRLDDRDASDLIRIVYGALAEGATFSFPIVRRRREEILELCAGAGIGNGNVAITAEAQSLRVVIAKLQS